MKYKVGDKTVLGTIRNEKTIRPTDFPENDFQEYDLYCVHTRHDKVWFTESEIDAIIIKPKRNIDHLVELIANGERANAVAFIDDCRQATSWLFWLHMLDEYAEPSRYPKLTPEELRAVKWLVEGGFTKISKNHLDVAAFCENAFIWIPNTQITGCLMRSEWIAREIINLAELLAAQEGTP